MFSVGQTLRRARLEQELDISTVEARTKINAKYLKAIEADDRASLPSSFFYKSFVHQYARSLSLDTREIDAEVDRMLSADAPLPLPGEDGRSWREIPPVELSSRNRRTKIYASLASFILILALCSGIYGWWHLQRSALAAPKNAPPAHIVVQATVSEQAPVVGQPAAMPVSSIAQAAREVQPSAKEPNPPAVSPPSESKVLVELLAREETWLSVSSDGKPVFSGILAVNQTKTVEGKQSAKLRVGNAAGIEVRFNGRPIGPLGHRGQVLIVVFTRDNFQVVTAAKESD
jgi:cytoskeleton protein RodZ